MAIRLGLGLNRTRAAAGGGAPPPPAYVNDKAILFDGGDDRLEGAALTPSLNFDSTDPWSVSLWLATESPNYQFIVSKIDPGGANQGWAVGLYAGKPIALLIHDLASGWQLERAAVEYVTTGSMKNLVYTYDGSEAVAGLKMYVDGSEVGGYINYATSVRSPITNSEPLSIGTEIIAKGADFYDGILDEVAIFDRVLTLPEIANIYSIQDSAQGKAGDLSALAGLLSYYRCGDAPGDSTAVAGTQFDAAGSNDLTAYNMTAGSTNTDNSSAYKVRTSTDFDGVDDFCEVTSPPLYEYNTPFSVSAWFNTTAITYAGIISKMEGGGNYRGWQVYLHSGGQMRVEIMHGLGNYLDVFSLGSTYNTGTWHHVTMVYTAATPGDVSDVTVYIDAAPIAMTTLSNTLGSNTILNAEPMRIGRRGAPSSLEFLGNICNVALYDRALTAGEVTDIYGGGSPPDLSLLPATWGDLDAWWRMGDAAGDTTDTPGTMAVAGPQPAMILTCNNMTDDDIETDVP